jgi:cyclophilin family peptidyl-prolyl cis-trans isomerase
MYSASRHAIAWSIVLAIVAVAGCGSDNDETTEAEPKSQSEQDSESSGEPTGSAPAEQTAGASTPAPPSKPRVLIKTSLGDITVELNPEKAVNTVLQFQDNIKAGYYDNTIFHHVDKGYVVMGGSFTPDMLENAERMSFYNEARGGMSNVRGTIAMSRQPQDKNSATCQFFFNLDDNSSLLDHKESLDVETTDQDYGYCVFGTVVDGGMDVVDRIGNAKVHTRGDFEQTPEEQILIISITEL